MMYWRHNACATKYLPTNRARICKPVSWSMTLIIAMLLMYAGTSDLDHARTQMLQTVEKKLIVGIVIADTPCCFRPQNSIGADNFVAQCFTHNQMFAIGIVMINVMLQDTGLQMRTLFVGKYFVAQALCRQHIIG